MAIFNVTHQLRCHVRRGGHERIAQVCGMLNRLYNAGLQERRDAWRMAGESLDLYYPYSELTLVRGDDPGWAALDVNVARGVLRRVDLAMKAFFRRVKEGGTPGFPRFKPVSRFRCIELATVRPGMVRLSEGGKKAFIQVKGLPSTQLRLKRSLPSSDSLKSLRLVKRPNGWYADLVYAVEMRWVPCGIGAVGLDFGVNNRVALSTGEMVERRELDRSREDRLRQELSRCQKGSNRRRKAVSRLSRETRRNAVRNRNECHRITTGIVRRFGKIADEKLKIRNMTRIAVGAVEEPKEGSSGKRGLNREILAQTWGILREQMRYKAEWAGAEFDPKFTSTTCSVCGERTLQGEYRTYACGECGHVDDRDTNAAKNVCQRAFGPTGAGISPALRR